MWEFDEKQDSYIVLKCPLYKMLTKYKMGIVTAQWRSLADTNFKQVMMTNNTIYHIEIQNHPIDALSTEHLSAEPAKSVQWMSIHGEISGNQRDCHSIIFKML